jgi:hypothetical protein
MARTQTDDDDDGTKHGCTTTWCDAVPRLAWAQFVAGVVLGEFIFML